MICSVCKSEFEPKLTSALPFCSEYCRLIDLGRWLDENNTLPDFTYEEPPGEADQE